MANTENSTDKQHFHAKFGNKEYYFHLCLYNNEGNITILKKNTLVYFELEDNIFNPFESATLIITNNENVIEKTSYPYVFLGNGRDIVDIEITPIITGSFNDIQNEELRDYMTLKFKFVVTECVEVTFNNTICKKLTLVEYAQYMLSENICNIFTLQKSGAIGANYIATNGANSKTTGDILKSLIYAVYNDGVPTEDMFYKDKSGNIIFETDQSTDAPITLSPYGCVSYADVLAYVLPFHTYSDSPCLLSFDRYQKKFQLISLATVFKDSTKELYETLIFTGQGDPEAQKSGQWAIEFNHSSETFEESKIGGGNFFIESPTSRYNISQSSNSGIMSTNRGTKSMIFDLQTLNAENFNTKFNELFVKPFENVFSSYKLVPNYHLSPNSKNNYNTYQSVLPDILNEKQFLNQKLNSLLYLNNVYQFTLDGMTFRKSMTFLDVLKRKEIHEGQLKTNTWDLNNLGRHFVVSVKHIFTQDTYKNVIETIKPYKLQMKGSGSITSNELLGVK